MANQWDTEREGDVQAMSYRVYYAGNDTGHLRMYRTQFADAVRDFIERSGQDYEFDRLWWDLRFMDLFFVIDEQSTDLAGFFTLAFPVKNPQTGQPIVATIVHGWANPKAPHAIKYAFQFIDEHAVKSGILKVNMATKRNDEAFERYFSKFGYERSDVIFEKNFTRKPVEDEVVEPLQLVEAK